MERMGFWKGCVDGERERERTRGMCNNTKPICPDMVGNGIDGMERMEERGAGRKTQKTGLVHQNENPHVEVWWGKSITHENNTAGGRPTSRPAGAGDSHLHWS